jgi:hypothetical protein
MLARQLVKGAEQDMQHVHHVFWLALLCHGSVVHNILRARANWGCGVLILGVKWHACDENIPSLCHSTLWQLVAFAWACMHKHEWHGTIKRPLSSDDSVQVDRDPNFKAVVPYPAASTLSLGLRNNVSNKSCNIAAPASSNQPCIHTHCKQHADGWVPLFVSNLTGQASLWHCGATGVSNRNFINTSLHCLSQIRVLQC